MSRFVRLRPDWFLMAMVCAVFLAWLFPAPGSEGGSLHPDLITKFGVAVMFFLHGLLLSFEDLKHGAKQWKAHAAIQATTFIVFPLLGLVFYQCTGGMVDPDLQMGFFFLCALPSTVSSAVAMSGAARGNVAVAVFNATLSSLIGIVLTPLWISFALHQQAQSGGFGATIVTLCEWLLLPLVVGQILSPSLGNLARRHKKYVGKTDRVLILLMVYSAFCDSFTQNIWRAHGARGMGITIAAIVLLFFTILLSLWWLCDRFAIAPPLRTAIVFCGTKKTLSSGVAIGRLIFMGHPGIGLILLPIMIYHPLQLFVCGPLAGHWARQQGTRQQSAVRNNIERSGSKE